MSVDDRAVIERAVGRRSQDLTSHDYLADLGRCVVQGEFAPLEPHHLGVVAESGESRLEVSDLVEEAVGRGIWCIEGVE